MQECLKLILEQGGDVACRDANGMTPLHWALQFPSQCSYQQNVLVNEYLPFVYLLSDNLVACSLLLNNGADPKAKENDGLTGTHCDT